VLGKTWLMQIGLQGERVFHKWDWKYPDLEARLPPFFPVAQSASNFLCQATDQKLLGCAAALSMAQTATPFCAGVGRYVPARLSAVHSSIIPSASDGSVIEIVSGTPVDCRTLPLFY
jgi:hypothetical protein